MKIRLALVVLVLSLLPTLASAEDSKAMRWGLRALDVVWSADLAVTMYAVGSRQADELNPAWRWAQHRPLVFGLVRGGAQVGVREYVRRTKSAKLAWAITGIGVGVLAWNATQLRGAR